MSRLHLYNPANDLALGLGCRHYTPPPNAASLQRAGALLPMWWAADEDYIIVPEGTETDVARLKSLYGLKGTPVTEAPEPDLIADPWGWSADAVRIFENAGIDRSLLPSESDIRRMRDLSHRRTSIKVLTELGLTDLLPLETSDPAEVVEMEQRHPGCYIKSPWSGSGRGVFCAGGLSPEILASKAAGIIHRQGSVMVERGAPGKQADFAMLYYIKDERAEFRGLSMFLTESRGMYSGNIVATQEWLWEHLSALAGRTALEETAVSVASALSATIGNAYTGWVGVDMLIYGEGHTHPYSGGQIHPNGRGHTHPNVEGQIHPNGRGRIHPCIEVNLRRTMGVVAMDIATKLTPSNLATSPLTPLLPALLSWYRGTPSGLPLLPPSENWNLTLTTLNHHTAKFT